MIVIYGLLAIGDAWDLHARFEELRVALIREGERAAAASPRFNGTNHRKELCLNE